MLTDISPYILALYYNINYNSHSFSDRKSDFISIVDPAMKGTTLGFECPPGYVLIGPNTTTCTENGEWEPGG